MMGHPRVLDVVTTQSKALKIYEKGGVGVAVYDILGDA